MCVEGSSSRAYERLNDTVGVELPDSVIHKVMDAQHEDRAAGRDKVSITMWKRAPAAIGVCWFRSGDAKSRPDTLRMLQLSGNFPWKCGGGDASSLLARSLRFGTWPCAAASWASSVMRSSVVGRTITRAVGAPPAATDVARRVR
eukprot:COSAG02_NODE_8872_length_2415_cov_22.702504_3_plen_145_part_00